jgi:conjugative transfer pilus assembly protein TraH
MKAASAAIFLLISAAAAPVKAELQGQMDKMFGAMVNVTPPSVFETQRRGGIAGGSVNLRTKVVNEQLISFTPPSFEAGCGGIDMYMGSFSFISKEQFIQLMRSVAANAPGYAFNLALGAICEKCQQSIETLQKKIQEFNQFFGNSCQLSKGLVTNPSGAMDEAKNKTMGLISAAEGAASDIFGSLTKLGNTNPLQKANAVAPQRVNTEVKGNLMWRALKKAGSSGWFVGGDDRLDEVIMNITGTVIVGDEKRDSTNKGESLELRRISGGLVPLRTLVKGGIVSIYGCDTKDPDGCKNPSKDPSPYAIRGFETMVREVFLGSGNSVGILAKQRLGGSEFTEAEKSALSQTEFGGLILRLNAHTEHGARSLADLSAAHLAAQYAIALMDGLIRAAESANDMGDNPHAKEVLDMIRQARTNLNREYSELQCEIGPYPNMLQYYTSILQAIPKTANGTYFAGVRKQ